MLGNLGQYFPFIAISGGSIPFHRVRMKTSTDTAPAEFGRFDDLDSKFGIRRSKAYQLLADGKIRSVCLKRNGARTGVRLIDLGSVRQYLQSQSQ